MRCPANWQLALSRLTCGTDRRSSAIARPAIVIASSPAAAMIPAQAKRFAVAMGESLQ